MKLNLMAALIVFLIFVVMMQGDSSKEFTSQRSLNSGSVSEYGMVELENSNVLFDEGEDEADESEDDNTPASGSEEEADTEQEDEEREVEVIGDNIKLKNAQVLLQGEFKPTFNAFFKTFQNPKAIKSFLEKVVDTYSQLGVLTSQSIGKTYEKRDIEVFSLGKGANHVIVLGPTDGSDWSSIMDIVFAISRLVQLYGINDAITNALNTLTIDFIPLVNPDGTEYTHSSKSHSAHSYNLNRASHKGHKGYDLAEDWASFSQLESQAIQRFMSSLEEQISGVVHVECCGGYVQSTYNDLCWVDDSKQAQALVGQKIGHEFDAVFSVEKKPSKKSHMERRFLHWVSESLGINLAYTISGPASKTKLRSKSEMPEAEIVDHGRQVTKGIMAMLRYITEEDYAPGNRHCDAGDSKPKFEASNYEEVEETEDEINDDEREEREEDDMHEVESEDDEEMDTEDDTPNTESEEGDNEDDVTVEEPKELSQDREFFSVQEESVTSGNSILKNSLQYLRQHGNVAEVPEHLDDSNSFLYFAYGPDMFADVLFQVGLDAMQFVGTATLSGYHFDYTYYSKLTWKSGIVDILKHRGSVVHGVLYRVPNPLKSLLEAFNLAGRDSSRREAAAVDVTMHSGKTVQSLVYRSTTHLSGDEVLFKYKRFKPSRQYRNCIIKGAKMHGLPFDYIENHLRSISAMYSDKIGSVQYRNPHIGTVCDVY